MTLTVGELIEALKECNNESALEVDVGGCGCRGPVHTVETDDIKDDNGSLISRYVTLKC